MTLVAELKALKRGDCYVESPVTPQRWNSIRVTVGRLNTDGHGSFTAKRKGEDGRVYRLD